MKSSRLPYISVALGVVLLLTALVVLFVLVPHVSKLPGDLEVTNRSEGTGTLLNPAALQTGDTAHVIVKDVPVSVDQHIYVSDTDGNTAIAHNDITVHAPGGIALPNNHTYAVDRKSMESAPAPAGIPVEPHTGITIGLPIHPDPDADYKFYDSATQRTVPMNYTGTKSISGRSVLTYTIDIADRLADPAILGVLPPVLPKAQLAQLAPLLPAEILVKITPDMLAALPDPVPVAYTSVTKYNFAFDETMGIPIDGSVDQQVIANVSANGQTISLIPVLASNTELTDDSVANAADTAKSAARLLTVGSLVVPITFGILGVGLVVAGFVVYRRRPSQPDSQNSAPVEAALSS